MTDIQYSTDNKTYRNRTTALIIHESKILLAFYDIHWALPGGKVKLLENSHDAIKREIKEELSLEVKDAVFLATYENFFMHKEIFNHELGFLYKTIVSKEDWFVNKVGKFQNPDDIEGNTFKWFDIDDLPKINLLPKFLIQDIKGFLSAETGSNVVNNEIRNK